MSAFFTHDELASLKAMEKKTLSGVICHFWQNKTRPDDVFEFLDKLELLFNDGTRIVITANEEDETGIEVVNDFNAEKNRLMLLQEFGGRIDLRSEDFSDNAIWAFAIGKKIENVKLVDIGDNCYSNNAVLLDFGDEKLEIHPGMEGLIVEPYEEV